MRQGSVLLIGGTSHAGKSTVAGHIGRRTGRVVHATDRLAKHPGRPWVGPDGKAVPQHVVEHYTGMSPGDLLADVLAHYGSNVIPKVAALVGADGPEATRGSIVEGSALWPPFVADLLDPGRTAAAWLVVGDDTLVARIRSESRYAAASADQKRLIDTFVGRTLAYNARLKEELDDRGFVRIDADGVSSNEVASLVLERLQPGLLDS